MIERVSYETAMTPYALFCSAGKFSFYNSSTPQLRSSIAELFSCCAYSVKQTVKMLSSMGVARNAHNMHTVQEVDTADDSEKKKL